MVRGTKEGAGEIFRAAKGSTRHLSKFDDYSKLVEIPEDFGTKVVKPKRGDIFDKTGTNEWELQGWSKSVIKQLTTITT